MGTPAGVGPLQPGDVFTARLDDVLALHGRIVARRCANLAMPALIAGEDSAWA